MIRHRVYKKSGYCTYYRNISVITDINVRLLSFSHWQHTRDTVLMGEKSLKYIQSVKEAYKLNYLLYLIPNHIETDIEKRFNIVIRMTLHLVAQWLKTEEPTID